MSAPLIVTRDEPLLDELLRLSAAAGVVPEVVPDVTAALRAWTSAPLVFVGVDLAAGLAGAKPPRRDSVHVVAMGGVPDEAFKLAVDLGAEDVVDVALAGSWVVELFSDIDEPAAPGRLIGVIGGSGGAGATTLACAVAQVAARRGPSVVVDLDPLGPGVDAVLGIDAAVGVRWDGLVQTVGRVSARSLREALPRRQQVGVLTWGTASVDLPVFALREALSAAQRGHDAVVVDLPRRTDALVDEVVPRCDLLVLVVRPTVVGVASAQRLWARLGCGVPPAVVVRGAGLPADDVARILALPLLAAMLDQRGLGEAVDLGAGPVRSQRGPLARAARAVLGAAA